MCVHANDDITIGTVLLAELILSIFIEGICSILMFSILSFEDLRLSLHLKGSIRGYLRDKFNFRLTLSPFFFSGG